MTPAEVAAFAAVDLGASSGRVMLGLVSPDAVELHEVHRVVNRPVRVGGTLHWDVLALWTGVTDGLRLAGRDARLRGVGVDSWAVDYALLDEDGTLVGNPIHYRDARTAGVAEAVDALMDPSSLYEITGVQRLPFNTIYQLVAAGGSAALRRAGTLLLIPDLFGYWLTGERGAEVTNASTTGLLDVRAREWSIGVAGRLGLPVDLLPAVREPGELVGPVAPAVSDEFGLARAPVWTVASHDTASAVLGVPARSDAFAYVSCGTWSIVGVELTAPVTTGAARAANFSNELGVDGTVRFLRNVMGLWLLQESMRTWQAAGTSTSLEALLARAAALPPRSFVDPDRPEFLPPGDLPARLAAECRRTGQPVPSTPAEFVRCVLDSLAAAYGRTVHDAAVLSGTVVEVVHLVGGGARNELLCQLTADACEVPVLAGPVEAAALGNVLVQARAAGVVRGDRDRLRALLGERDVRVYRPRVLGDR
jgi:sugar (pentulose or hexulose) kinase